jgi:cobalamin synthase
VGSGLIWLFFEMRMLDGWQLADVSPRHMLWTYVMVVVAMIVWHSLAAAILAAKSKGEPRKDERDLAIEARSERVEGYIVLATINVLVIHALAQAAYPSYEVPRIDLASVPAIVFALISALFLGHIGKQIATIWSYRE